MHAFIKPQECIRHSYTLFSIRRLNTTIRPNFGIAFDIDGVLLRGGKELPGARNVIENLQERQIPHIFLTNGGGCMEEVKAQSLSAALNLTIPASKMVLSHTPMQELVNVYRDSRVLVLGSYDVYNVVRATYCKFSAKQYGLKKVVTVEELASHEPTQYPFRQYEHAIAPHHEEPIAAILIMHDPVDWAPEIQVAVDALIGGIPLGISSGSFTQTPLFVSNEDFVFSSSYPAPRFAQGAFTRCLKLLYEELTGKTLEITPYGKPNKNTYNFAENLLNQQFKNLDTSQNKELERIYMIGDNPHSDIHGANIAGPSWTSILVETGVFSPHVVSNSQPPDHLIPDVQVPSVREALEYIYKQEGLKK